MGTPFIGEIKVVAFNFAPQGWAFCNGQFLPINQNQALFSLLGTMYGGNGQTTFALPDLRGRVPIHFNTNTQGQALGEPSHTLTMAEMASHTHVLNANTNSGQNNPPGAVLAKAAANMYGPPSSQTTMGPNTVGNTGGSQPHENRQPFLVLNFCIALVGMFPSRN
jgi:microcystin-dependent protein